MVAVRAAVVRVAAGGVIVWSALSGIAGRAVCFDDDAFSEWCWPPLVEYNFARVDESASFVDSHKPVVLGPGTCGEGGHRQLTGMTDMCGDAGNRWCGGDA